METLAIDSPLGKLDLYAEHDHLVALGLPEARWPLDLGPATARTTPVLAHAARELAEFFAGDRREFTIPLKPRGTEFQLRVWTALCTIPYGETWSYAQLARAIDQPTASRAVGAANGKNPIAIIIPCHRVIGASGALVGYGGGLPTKQLLLALETRQHTLAL